jgi:hypothetical protein
MLMGGPYRRGTTLKPLGVQAPVLDPFAGSGTTLVAVVVAVRAAGTIRAVSGRRTDPVGAIDVTSDQLIDSGQQLKAIGQDLQFAHHRVEGLRSSQIGSKSIDSSLNQFADHWNYGMHRLVKKVDMTGEALLVAGQRYADLEAHIAAAPQASQ